MMGVVIPLSRYRAELERQRGLRCDDCGALVLDRVQMGKAKLCGACAAAAYAFAGTGVLPPSAADRR